MKKLLILLCISSLFACTNAGTEKKETIQAPEETHHEATELALNNGARWKSDESTNKNVAELEAITDRFTTNQPKLTADFTSVANELQTGLDKMIKECRMQGADHEALHQWLEPLMKNVNELKKANDEKEASKLFNEISEQLINYHQYFE
ncbi:MAG TPA: hypothetical protein VL095_06990 [Flavisolibacter sp.]|nr:hypothetical protein [Flavisolibacter sp.]